MVNLTEIRYLFWFIVHWVKWEEYNLSHLLYMVIHFLSRSAGPPSLHHCSKATKWKLWAQKVKNGKKPVDQYGKRGHLMWIVKSYWIEENYIHKVSNKSLLAPEQVRYNEWEKVESIEYCECVSGVQRKSAGLTSCWSFSWLSISSKRNCGKNVHVLKAFSQKCQKRNKGGISSLKLALKKKKKEINRPI